jgi:hypothetical protein
VAPERVLRHAVAAGHSRDRLAAQQQLVHAVAPVVVADRASAGQNENSERGCARATGAR